ncbi:MAG: hypothetical protein AAF645_02765 [Myxococcota bacterium]
MREPSAPLLARLRSYLGARSHAERAEMLTGGPSWFAMRQRGA